MKIYGLKTKSKKNNSIAAYDDISRVCDYDKDMNIMHPKRRKMIDVALQFLSFEESSPLLALDLGVGTGYFSKKVVEKYPHANIAAIDGSKSMIDMAKQRLKSHSSQIEFLVGKFNNLPFLVKGYQNFDLIYSSYALHHLNKAEKLAVIKTCQQVLKKSGIFINADIFTSKQYNELEKRIQQIRVEEIIHRANGEDKRFQNFASTRQFLDKLEGNECDQPQTFTDEINVLAKAGFREYSILWLEYREAVFAGIK